MANRKVAFETKKETRETGTIEKAFTEVSKGNEENWCGNIQNGRSRGTYRLLRNAHFTAVGFKNGNRFQFRLRRAAGKMKTRGRIPRVRRLICEKIVPDY